MNQAYGMAEIPQKYKENGVAAFYTEEDALNAISELSSAEGFRYKMIVDDQYGVVVVVTDMSTGYHFGEFEKAKIKIPFDTSEATDVDLALAGVPAGMIKRNLKAFFSHDYSQNDAEALLQSLEQEYQVPLEMFVCWVNETDALYAISEAPLLLKDKDGVPIEEGDVVYNERNEMIKINNISREKLNQEYTSRWCYAANGNYDADACMGLKHTLWAEEDVRKETKAEKNLKKAKEKTLNFICVITIIFALAMMGLSVVDSPLIVPFMSAFVTCVLGLIPFFIIKSAIEELNHCKKLCINKGISSKERRAIIAKMKKNKSWYERHKEMADICWVPGKQSIDIKRKNYELKHSL